ncbi:MAG: redoxin domain-containing protein [Deltaproteobacteria bacterium]|nr:redoxin domain-containing protein [Deltaproteobacteria bacterium]
MPTVGEAAPDFKLQSTEDREISLGEYKGKKNVVIAFYPLDFSPVCSVQIPDYNEHLKEFDAADTVILGISRDSVYAHKAWREELGGIEIPLLADMKGEVAEKYGVYLPQMGISGRAVFVVDKEGVLRQAHIEQKLQEKRSAEEVLEMVRSLG